MNAILRELVREQRIIVCCGAGGVGKTTCAASIGVAAAREGRRVLVLTIDPSKRLAQTLGVGRNHPTPTLLAREKHEELGITGGGALSAWMIDPKLVADTAVRRIIKDPEEVRRFLNNRIYQRVTGMIAGMHEYTAMEALHELVESGDYDLVVLDTPPSRDALNFLDAPARLSAFLDGTVFKLFVPKDGGTLMKVAAKVIHPVMSAVFGTDLFGELQVAFGTFGGIFRTLNGNAQNMREYLSKPDVSFLLVTSPFPEARAEAKFFRRRIDELGLPFKGTILNRSFACDSDWIFPDASLLPEAVTEAHRSALKCLIEVAQAERDRAEKHMDLLDELCQEAPEGGFAVSLPEMQQTVDNLRSLGEMAAILVNPQDTP